LTRNYRTLITLKLDFTLKDERNKEDVDEGEKKEDEAGKEADGQPGVIIQDCGEEGERRVASLQGRPKRG
jgi:hypothetical protein